MSIVRRTSPPGEVLVLRQPIDRLFEDPFVRVRSLESPVRAEAATSEATDVRPPLGAGDGS